jgi:hypothetical protein
VSAAQPEFAALETYTSKSFLKIVVQSRNAVAAAATVTTNISSPPLSITPMDGITCHVSGNILGSAATAALHVLKTTQHMRCS